MKNIIKIGNRKIGEKFKPFIICELGINHNGSLKLAKKWLIWQSNLKLMRLKKFIFGKDGSARKFINMINKKRFWLTSRQKYFVKN